VAAVIGDGARRVEHGVAQYLGLRELSSGENKGDYMVLEYSAGAKLYVPLTRMDLVQRFRGAGESKPALDRMERPGYDPFSGHGDMAPWRRHWAIWKASRSW